MATYKRSKYISEERIEQAAREYHPCDTGLHVCGHIGPENRERPLTVANFRTRTAKDARALFERAKAECAAAEGEPEDYCVDLNISRDEMHVEDFPMSRQMLERLCAIAAGRHPAL